MNFDKPEIIPFFKGAWEDWNGEDWILTEDWTCRISMIFENKPVVFMILARKGTRTDFGSIPKFARSWINKMGKGIVGFLPHDMLCGCEYFTRLFNDTVMYECHEWVNLSHFKNLVMYRSVRIAGSGYGSHTEISIKKHREHIAILPITGITEEDIYREKEKFKLRASILK